MRKTCPFVLYSRIYLYKYGLRYIFYSLIYNLILMFYILLFKYLFYLPRGLLQDGTVPSVFLKHFLSGTISIFFIPSHRISHFPRSLASLLENGISEPRSGCFLFFFFFTQVFPLKKNVEPSLVYICLSRTSFFFFFPSEFFLSLYLLH